MSWKGSMLRVALVEGKGFLELESLRILTVMIVLSTLTS